MKGSTKKIAIGALIAGVSGYVAGILTAPKSGKETRGDIKEVAVTTTAEAEKRLKELHTELTKLISEAKERSSKYSGRAKTELDRAIKGTSKAKQKAREILSAIHEGDAEDKDLKRAVNETSKAVQHLKKYLVK